MRFHTALVTARVLQNNKCQANAVCIANDSHAHTSHKACNAVFDAIQFHRYSRQTDVNDFSINKLVDALYRFRALRHGCGRHFWVHSSCFACFELPRWWIHFHKYLRSHFRRVRELFSLCRYTVTVTVTELLTSADCSCSYRNTYYTATVFVFFRMKYKTLYSYRLPEF
eukprot:6322226-Amphidinium_carterae.1